MKKILLIASTFALASTAVLAQYTTECTPGIFGTVTCTTNPSDPFYYYRQQQQQEQQLQLYREQQQQQQQMRLEEIRARWATIRQQCRGTWSEDSSLDFDTTGMRKPSTGSGKCWNN
jgi:hypothetical protein